MRPLIKEDILNALTKSIEALKNEEYLELTRLSNHTIHDASIFQEDDPLTIAVVIYAISKIIQRCREKGFACPTVIPSLERARSALMADDENAFRSILKNLLGEISAMDSRLKMYIQEVLDKAKIKKASKLHEHGISVARTAELLGLSQWELQEYISKTVIETASDGVRVTDRLRKARELFR